VPLLPKRVLVGRPLHSDRLEETLLPKRLALPVFCSDPLSSVAYATEQIVLVLGLGGVALLHLTPRVGLAVAALLIIVVASYRQTCYAYPNGGGAYAVSKDNLGPTAALVAASALLVDYVLTVAVSVVAGVAAITSAAPSLAPHAVALSLSFVLVLCLMNLRGVRESGTAFAIPTYGFVALVLAMLAVAAVKLTTGGHVVAESASFSVVAAHGTGGWLTVFLVLRAFASGCTALTGVEAISNGVPSFRPPKSVNAARTLMAMGGLAVVMFGGITALAVSAKVHMAENPHNLIGLPVGAEQKTALSQLGLAVFGSGTAFYLLQAFTAAILVLAANTAYNGFPVLASILSRDGYLPRQLSRRGDRLVFSNGIILLTAVAGGLIIAFDAQVTRLIQLYIIGVFVSFTLSQLGMVRHWQRERSAGKEAPTIGSEQRGLRGRQAINALGATATGVVLVIVLVTKFAHGAWIVVVAMPLLFALMRVIKRHYDAVRVELEPAAGGVPLPSRVHAVVLVSKLHSPTLQALAYAKATHPHDLVALTVRTDPAETAELERRWQERGVPVDLVVLDSPFREVTRPVLKYIRDRAARERNQAREVVAVFIPEYVVGRWWEQVLHNQSALRLKARLLFVPGAMVISVPWLLHSSNARSRELAARLDATPADANGGAGGTAPNDVMAAAKAVTSATDGKQPASSRGDVPDERSVAVLSGRERR
jgi:amino acid transporter